MARATIEDCLPLIGRNFKPVQVAANRTRQPALQEIAGDPVTTAVLDEAGLLVEEPIKLELDWTESEAKQISVRRA